MTTNPEWAAFLAGRGAVLADDATRAASFGDPQRELQAAAGAAVVCDLSCWSVIGFAGEDAQEFLQGQLTCDVREATRTSSRPGALCTPKGRALGTFRLWQDETGYLMQLPVEVADAVRKRLTMYVLRSKVKVADRSAESVRLGVAGPQAASALAQALDLGSPDALPVAPSIARFGAVQVLALGAGRHELIVAPADAPALWDRLCTTCVPAGAPAWAWVTIHAGEALLGVPTQDQFVPQMLNLDLTGGIGFQKGCYTGQEIVARTHYLGKLKQRMFVAHLPAGSAVEPVLPLPGTLLYSADFDGQSTGMVVDAALAPGGGVDLLAVIRTDSAANQSMHLGGVDGPLLEQPRLPVQEEAGPRGDPDPRARA